MELKFDVSKTYAIALEGGGAKGGYEVGVWQALDEAGVKYNAVSGTSVGALNGSLMAMRDLPRAAAAWKDMRLSKIMQLDAEQEENLGRAFSGELELDDIYELVPDALHIIKHRGLDVAPLRAWVHEIVDAEKIKNSDVELFVTTVSLSDRKTLEIKVNDLEEDEICDMLLASAYHPSFRLEPLGGKLYADGGFFDSLPLHVLFENGYRDIIAVRIPGIGRERHIKIPDDANISYISPTADLGGVLNFDAEQARRDMALGYLDGQKLLYGLYGKEYYIDRSLTERQALDLLLDCMPEDESMREYCEKELPKIARKLDVDGGYYELLIAILEGIADSRGIEKLKIYKDEELLDLLTDKNPE